MGDSIDVPLTEVMTRRERARPAGGEGGHDARDKHAGLEFAETEVARGLDEDAEKPGGPRMQIPENRPRSISPAIEVAVLIGIAKPTLPPG